MMVGRYFHHDRWCKYYILLAFSLIVIGQELFVDKQVSSFGQTLTLLCRLETVCNQTVGWEVWNPSSSTLDVRNFTIDPRAKYSLKERVDSLYIRNLSRDDLNKSYTCNCIFTRSGKLFLTDHLVFKNMTLEVPTETTTSVLSKSKVVVGILLTLPLAAFGVTVFLCIKYRIGKKRPVFCCYSKRGNVEGEETALRNVEGEETALINVEEEETELSNVEDEETALSKLFRYTALQTLGFLPSAIQQMGDEKIEEYKRILKAGKEKRYYVKMFFLGKNGVGKTSLMRRLLKEEIANVESTHGLDIVKRCKISVPDGEWVFNMGKIENSSEKVYADCVMVDFAGEKEYYITHQTFLTVNAVFLLTVRLLDEKIYSDNIPDEEKISFWLDNIHCYATKREIYIEQAAIQENHIPETDKDNKLDPPVIVVCTHATEEDPSVRENRKCDLGLKKETFLANLCEVVEVNNRKDHLCGNIQYLSNKSDTTDNFQELRNLIYRSASTLPDWGKEVPTRWVDLETELDSERNQCKQILEFTRIREIADRISTDFTENEIIFFLNYQHLSGNLIFFEDIKDLIILDPKWLIDVFKCLVCAGKFQSKVEHFCIWRNVEKTGEIKKSDIKELLSSISETFDRTFIIDVMEKFDILVNEITANNTEDLYVIPSMIKRQKPDSVEYQTLFANARKSSWLCLTFDLLPPALFNHMIVRFMRDLRFGREELRHGMCILNRQNTRKMQKLIICKFSNTIAFQYVLLDDEDSFSSWSVFENAKIVLENVNTVVQYCTSGARYGMVIHYRKQVMCNFQFDSSNILEHTVEIETLKQKTKFYCKHGNVRTNHDAADEIYKFWIKNVEMFEIVENGRATIQDIERSMKRFERHMLFSGVESFDECISSLKQCLVEEKQQTDLADITQKVNHIRLATRNLKREANKVLLRAYTEQLRCAVENAKELLQARQIRMLRVLLESDQVFLYQRQTLERQVEKLKKLADKCKDVPPETIEQATKELREMIDKCFKEANKEKLQWTVQDAEKLISTYLRNILYSDQDHFFKKQIANIDYLIDNCKDVAPETIEQAVEELKKLIE